MYLPRFTSRTAVCLALLAVLHPARGRDLRRRPPPALPGHPRRDGGLQLLGGHLHRRRGRGPRAPSHHRRGPGALPPLLPRREVDRLHRPLRRNLGRLRHARDRGRAAAAHLVPLADQQRAHGLGQHGHRLDPRRADPVPRPAQLHQRLRGRALHGEPAGRPGGALPPARVGNHLLRSRRQAHRLHPHLPRLPHLEALPGRHGPGRVDPRPGLEGHRAPDRLGGHRHPAHVDRRRRLLPLRPRGLEAEPVALRPRARSRRAGSPASPSTT